MGMNLFQLPFAYVVWGHDRRFLQTFGPLRKNYISQEFRVKFVNAMRGLAAHLQARNALDLFTHSLWDEPFPEQYPQLAELAALMKKACPAYKPSAFGASLAGVRHLEEPILGAAGLLTPDVAAALKAQGRLLSVYNPSHVFNVTRRPEYVRGFMWWAFRMRVDRVYHWCIGPWRGMDRADYGDCWVFEDPGRDEFLCSVRFELAREGSEDHDYLALYEQAARRAGERIGARGFDAGRGARDYARMLAGDRALDASTNPADYAAFRSFLAAAIERMDEPPLVVVHPARAESGHILRIWTEPDARVEANAARVSMREGRGAVSLRRGVDSVRLVFERAGRSKTLVIPLR